MADELFLATAMVLATVSIHAIGWRLVSAIEGINGIILIGWSTAFFVTLIARMRRG